MSKLVFCCTAILLVLLSGCASPEESYSVSQDGTLSYANRPAPEYSQSLLKDNENLTMYKLSFDSKGQRIYGLLSIPKNSQKARNGIPGVFILYGATMTKEGEWGGMGQDLAGMGFAVLIIDQRGWGETGGAVPSLEQDFRTFSGGGEPVQHKMVYDALRCYDILKSRPEVDPARIYASGESMGGRYAMIAASMEKGIAGALIISSSGYGFESHESPEAIRFLKSVDPDHYMGGISPRPLVMAHSKNDSVIPFGMAQRTFLKAGEPKKLLVTESLDHSYIRKDMKGLIEKELEGW